MHMLYSSRGNAGVAMPPPSQRPTSPTFSMATTQASAVNISGGPEIIITRAHLRTSVLAYEELLRSCAAYRNALLTLSTASAHFASAIEVCSRLRGVGDDASVGFQAISGMYYLIANQERVLGESVRTQFDEPLRRHLQDYRTRIAERSYAYEQTLIEKNRIIRQTEAENMAAGRRGKTRDLNSFRAALGVLQKQVSDLDRLKAEYYTEVLAHEEETWDAALEKVALVVKSSLEVYDRISAKSSDPSLEPILQTIPDPFDAYGPQKSKDQIYSILPVGSILGNVANRSSASSPSRSPIPTTVSADSDHNVRTWMDQTAAACDNTPTAWYGASPRGLTPLGQEHGPVDWGDARVRRHSLPTPTALASSLASPSTVPFPTDDNVAESSLLGSTTVRPKHKEQSKLRQALSVIGEGSSHSRESTVERAVNIPIPEDDVDDRSTERGSVGSNHRTDPDEATVHVGNGSTSILAPSTSDDGGTGLGVRDALLRDNTTPTWP